MSDVSDASVDESSVVLEAEALETEPKPAPELPGQLTFGWGDDFASGTSRKRKKSKKNKASQQVSGTTDGKSKPPKAKDKPKKTMKRKPKKSSQSSVRKGSKKSKGSVGKVSAVDKASVALATDTIDSKSVAQPPKKSAVPASEVPAVVAKTLKEPKSAKTKTAGRTVTKKKKPARKAAHKITATEPMPAKVIATQAAAQPKSRAEKDAAKHQATSISKTEGKNNEAERPSSVGTSKSSVKSYAETVDALSLKWGAKLPSVGFGFWKVEKEQTAQVCYDAIQVGYRHLDCACDYGNEEEVGQGIQRAINDGLVDREDLWVTSKLWNTYHSPEHVRMACEKSLADLQLDYLDLYLIHFPLAQRFVPIEARYPPGWFFDPDVANPVVEEARVPIQATWQAMEELTKDGLVRNIGICNFGTSQIRDLLTYAHIRPAVLQVETHPRLTQPKLLRYCQQEKIAYTAFSPLGAQSYYSLNMADQSESLLLHPIVTAIAEKVDRTAAQVLLRWGVQRGTAVIPKTSSRDRMVENICVFDFKLSEEQMQQLDGLNEGRRFNDPGDFGEAAFNTYLPIYE